MPVTKQPSSPAQAADVQSHTKSDWRRLMRKQRAATTELERVRAVTAIANALAGCTEWQNARFVASFLAFGSELDLSPVDELARASGKTMVYPRVINTTVMEFHQWQPGQPLDLSDKGIREPPASAPMVAPVDIDFFLIPLLACDETGTRLGYGGGFYDRILAGSGGFRCGVGFSWQWVKNLPGETHDQPLQAFVSELGFTRIG